MIISLSVLLRFHCPPRDPRPSLLVSNLKEMKVYSCSLTKMGVPNTQSRTRNAEKYSSCLLVLRVIGSPCLTAMLPRRCSRSSGWLGCC